MGTRRHQLDQPDGRDQSAADSTPLINRDVSDLAFVRRVLKEDAELKARIRQEVFVAYFKDEANSWILQANDRWVRH